MQAYAVSMWSELSSCPDACASLRIASARCMIATTCGSAPSRLCFILEAKCWCAGRVRTLPSLALRLLLCVMAIALPPMASPPECCGVGQAVVALARRPALCAAQQLLRVHSSLRLEPLSWALFGCPVPCARYIPPGQPQPLVVKISHADVAPWILSLPLLRMVQVGLSSLMSTQEPSWHGVCAISGVFLPQSLFAAASPIHVEAVSPCCKTDTS
jgi:hypothetical protein